MDDDVNDRIYLHGILFNCLNVIECMEMVNGRCVECRQAKIRQ